MMENEISPAGDLNRQENSMPAQLPLDQVRPHIGDPVQLQVGSVCHVSTLIGYLKGQSVIVTLSGEQASQLQEGHPLTVRFSSDKRAYAFNTVVRHVASVPFPHVHLAYPQGAHALRERQHERVKINITGYADISDGKSISCVVRDISMGGALITVDGQTGAVNDKLVLTLHVVVNGVEYSLSLDSEIRSVRIGASPTGGAPSVMQGLSFQNLSNEDALALAAFDLLPDWNATA